MLECQYISRVKNDADDEESVRRNREHGVKRNESETEQR
jgi:hypothetical protein